jgi:hypothetical protein
MDGRTDGRTGLDWTGLGGWMAYGINSNLTGVISVENGNLSHTKVGERGFDKWDGGMARGGRGVVRGERNKRVCGP